ncbi:MAG: bifunctional diguanylate cyclase/phosphodiesterase [Pseudomonadota bacterium]|nr:bifunctional diguanylate cyclase/phosphodiesterase [Pseudomonadota bacterium]
MNEGHGLDLVLYLAQALCAVAQAAIFAYYYRVSSMEYLRLWGLSFVALALYLVAALLAVDFGEPPLASAPLRMLIATISLMGAYLQVALLALGTIAVLGKRPATPRLIGGVLIAAVLLGVITALLFAGPPEASMQRIVLRSALRYAITGAAYLIVAILLWRRARRSGLGARLAALAMGFYGVELLHVLAILIAETEFKIEVEWAPFVGVLDLVAQLFIGYGLVVWLLEDERLRYERADTALRRLRDFDPVTGFPNRRRLMSDLQSGLRVTNQRTATLLVRIDQSDMLSSSLGVVAAETVMAEAASRVQECALPEWPRPARLSETRLVQVVPHAHTGDLAAAADNLLAMLRAPFYSGGRELALSASIGIALSPDDAQEAAALIAAAEAAAQQAHDEGGNRLHFYSIEMNSLVLTRLSLQAELRRALIRHEFELHYQPLLAAQSHRLVGAEALVRWRHPKRGLLAPEMFIEEIDRLGMIEDLDRYVLERACREAQQWRARGGAPLAVAVNISTRSFQREHFPELVRAVLAATGLAPQRLELEVVESGALDDIDRAIDCLTRLRALGTRVSLDDFGTGYSSLNHLRRLPVDGLKIDRSFVEEVLIDRRAAAIVSAIITLAHSLGIETTVEGIETAAQLAWFERHQVDRLQGFHFARAMDPQRWRAMQDERDTLIAVGA